MKRKILLMLFGLSIVMTACSEEVTEPIVYEFEYEDLAQKTYEIPPEATPVPIMEFESFSAAVPDEVPIPEKNVDFQDLQNNVNGDICAWIYIPDTKVDYPVLQHPTDDSYYLSHNLNGTTGYPGCIYMESINSAGFTDPDTVLYGHNMKNGNMFAAIRNYADNEFMDTHPYVYIYTPTGVSIYKVFAAYQAGDEHILVENQNFEDLTVFENYLDSIPDKKSTPSRTSNILTLSTCITGTDTARFLVQCVRLN